MVHNNNILVGKSEKELCILTNMANRHGLITGASGSGKTITLKVIAEGFSDLGVPVFLADVKGDLAGMCVNGENSEKIELRIDALELENFSFKNFPTHFWDIYGEFGHPIRTTIQEVGASLLARMLGLTETQEGVLTIIFKIAQDNEWELIDLKDLRLILQYVGNKRSTYTLEYGNITLQSIGAIQRSLLVLEEQGGDYFFGKPNINVKDFIRFDAKDGRGYINILHAVKLFQNPNLYASFLLWLLTSLYNKLPEVGDLEKPKIVFFFDEAHLLFEEMPDYMIKQVIQIVKLIRSKGIGLYFISQSPKDIPDEVSSQLGNRIQHALRAYTPMEQKVIKAAKAAFRVNPNLNTEQAIMSLGTGEALISFLNEQGEPSIVEKATILPPQSMIGTISEEKRKEEIQNSLFFGKYDEKIETESAFEKLTKEIEKQEKETSSTKKENAKKQKKKTQKKSSTIDKIGTSLFKSLFK